MLHRSPSGAKRRIRQKAERKAEENPKDPDESSSPSAHSFHEAPPPVSEPAMITSASATRPISPFRELQQQIGYRSLLLPEPYAQQQRLAASPIITQFAAPAARPSPQSTTFGAVPAIPTLSSPAIAAATTPVKPTVEVHPMPAPRAPPPVPAKPVGLRGRTLHGPPVPLPRHADQSPVAALVSRLASSQSLTSLSTESASSSMSGGSLRPAGSQISLWNPLLNRNSSNRHALSRESLNALYDKTDFMDWSELELERAVETAESELEAAEQGVEEIAQAVERAGRPALAADLRNHLQRDARLAALEHKLRSQLSRVEKMTDSSESRWLDTRTRSQLDETRALRKLYEARDEELGQWLAHLLAPDRLQALRAHRRHAERTALRLHALLQAAAARGINRSRNVASLQRDETPQR